MRIEVRDLVVRYGAERAVDGVSFDVEPGTVFAMVGRNGAGKSSLVKVLLGQRRADHGQVAIDGRDPWRERAGLMREVGATPEVPDAPPGFSAADLEKHHAGFYPRWDYAGFRARLERFDLQTDSPFGSLSRGQKALLMLSLALAPQPKLLVLDDPTLGLDAVARRFVFDELIGELSEHGVTVFMTSHDLEGVERVATHLAILRAGRVESCGRLDELREEAARSGVEPPTLEEIFVRRTHMEVSA